MGLSELVEAMTCRATGPIDLLVAAGHGRCYAGPGRFLGRILPAIPDCGLWDALEGAQSTSTKALITDVGNDLMSGRSPTWIARRIEVCLARLSSLGADTLLTGLPMTNLTGLGSWRFRFFRSLLFPGRSLSLADVRQRARELDDHLAELAARYRTCLVEPDPDWFGLDGIHIRRSMRRRAWSEIVSRWWSAADPPERIDASRTGKRRKTRFAPERSTIFGLPRRRTQPALGWTDGGTLSCY